MRLIDADVLDAEIDEEYFRDSPSMILTSEGEQIFNSALDVARIKLRNAPTIDAIPALHGHWITPAGKHGRKRGAQCSECGRVVRNGGENYCPDCGLKMDWGV